MTRKGVMNVINKDTVTASERLRAFMVRRPDSPVRRFVRRMVEVGHIRRAGDDIPERFHNRRTGGDNSGDPICMVCNGRRIGQTGKKDNEQHEA